MSLFETFKKAIDTATTHMSKYKKAAKEYTDEVDTGLDTLAELIKRLKACIKQLVELQDNYISYIQRITQIRENMEIMLNKEITKAQSNSGEECDKQISELLKQFQGFVQTIGTWEKEGTRFETLLTELKTEIDALCKKAEQIMMQNEGNTGGLEREISELEAKLGQERGASKNGGDNETKQGPSREQTSVREQVQAVDQGNTQRAEDIANRRAARQQEAESRAIGRQIEGRNRRSSLGGLPGYDQGGGWQTPQKLESISRYSPIRRVTRKKKNNKKKNTKKNKKKRRRKQTKRQRKKRN